MEAKGEFTVAKSAFVPKDERARAIMSSVSIGDRVLLKVHKARNPEHHGLAWKVFDKVGAAVGAPAEKVLLWLKVATGRVDFERMPNGKVVGVPHSIRFESMSQADFQAFWDDAWPVITEQICPGLPQHEIDDLIAIVGHKDCPPIAPDDRADEAELAAVGRGRANG
jgi:hypothetical protein